MSREPRSPGPGSLAQLQERFYALVTAPDGVARALAAAGLGARDLGLIVAGDERRDAVARLDVYANMYFYRILDVLRDDYPKLVRAVGDPAFHNLVTEYLVACRPRHPSLAFAGDRLPPFLARHALGTERPWLVALGRLERAYTELFDGPDADTLGLADVRGLAPDDLAALPLALVPCHRLLEHPFAIDPVWRAIDESGTVEDAAVGPEVLLVWRQDLEVHHRRIDTEEHTLLAAAAAGTTLQGLCELIAAQATQDGARAVFTLVGRWLADGLVRSPRP